MIFLCVREPDVCSDNPSPMKSKYRRFALLRKKSFEPGSETEEKEKSFEQTFRTLEKEKYRCVQPKKLVKNVLMPVKNTIFSCGTFRMSKRFSLVSMENEVPLQTAYSQNGRCGMQPKSNLHAQAQLTKTRTETFEPDVATELGLAPSDNLKIIELRDLIINSDYDEEFVKNMPSVIVEERTATEKKNKKGCRN
ncbi:hypothetical protein TNCV_1095271 [Trichonephila clavipes]|nr:hypothetical protein TNCV_1095271 [Trichonephila clavipes]